MSILTGCWVHLLSPIFCSPGCSAWRYHVLQKFTERNPWILPISSLRIGREQHVPDSSNHSPCLIKLFSFSSPEGDLGGNQQPDGPISLSHQNRSIRTICTSVSLLHQSSLTLPLSSIVHHPSGPDSCALSSQAFSRSLAVAGAHVQAFTFIALAPNTTRNTETDTQRQTHGDRQRERQRQRETEKEDRERGKKEKETHFSSLLHHLPGADMCVALALKITVYTCRYARIQTHIHIHVMVSQFSSFLKKNAVWNTYLP